MKEPSNRTQVSARIQEMHKWELQFLDRCAKGRAARGAFRRLKEAGLDRASLQLLWEYANRGQKDFAEVQRGTALIVRNIQAFRRAEREERRRASDPRAQMFRQRREEASRILTETPWPFHNPGMQTFGDVARSLRSPELFDLRKIRALVARSNLGYMLAMLRAGCSAHGVRLSGNEVAALAFCATGKERYGSAVRRMLREPWVLVAEPGYRKLFENCYCQTCRRSST